MSGKKLIRNSTTEFLIFTGQAGEQSIEARYEDETVWLSQKLMAELFGVDVRTVNEHLKNIFASNELASEATIRKFRIVQLEGKREVTRLVDHYDLDVILAVVEDRGDVMTEVFVIASVGCLRAKIGVRADRDAPRRRLPALQEQVPLRRDLGRPAVLHHRRVVGLHDERRAAHLVAGLEEFAAASS